MRCKQVIEKEGEGGNGKALANCRFIEYVEWGEGVRFDIDNK